MIPEWMTLTDSRELPEGSSAFAVRTIKSVSAAVGKLRFQQGHEKKYAVPALVKLILLVLFIIYLSLNRSVLIMMAYTAVLLLYLSTWPPADILRILKGCLGVSLLTFVLLVPAMLMNPDGVQSQILLVWKVFLSILMVSIFNHTTQWNHITAALRKLHVPGIFAFTIDITMKYTVALGRFISDLMTSYLIRAVGKDDRRYQSLGGVAGVTFIRGTQMNREMYEAMRCRGFTDDYRGL